MDLMSKTRVLIVDDELETRRLLRTVLIQHGYVVQTAANCEEALQLAAQALPDLIIVDLVLPDMSGMQVIDAVRECGNSPVIAISAKTDEDAIVEALDHGADDYITKPFGLHEFLARVRVALRHATGEAPAPVLERRELRLDQVRRLVTVRGREVHMTPTEYEILRYLMLHAGKVITHGTLLNAVWGSGYEGDTSSLRVFITQLRRKIEPDPEHPIYILTVPRIGYRLC